VSRMAYPPGAPCWRFMRLAAVLLTLGLRFGPVGIGTRGRRVFSVS
jgi:hypothetical protein